MPSSAILLQRAALRRAPAVDTSQHDSLPARDRMSHVGTDASSHPQWRPIAAQARQSRWLVHQVAPSYCSSGVAAHLPVPAAYLETNLRPRMRSSDVQGCSGGMGAYRSTAALAVLVWNCTFKASTFKSVSLIRFPQAAIATPGPKTLDSASLARGPPEYTRNFAMRGANPPTHPHTHTHDKQTAGGRRSFAWPPQIWAFGPAAAASTV